MSTDITALRARTAEVDAEIAAGQAQLRAALLAGKPTTSIREYLAAADKVRGETEMHLRAAIAAADSAAAGEPDPAEAAKIETQAARIRKAALNRIEAARAALVVPVRTAGGRV